MSCGQPFQTDDALDDQVESSGQNLSATVKNCIRCSEPWTIQVRNSFYCQKCFQLSFSEKVRKGFDGLRQYTLQANVAIKRSGGKPVRPRFVFAYDGSITSRTLIKSFKQNLLDFSQTQSNSNYKARTWFDDENILFVWVDESGIAGRKAPFTYHELSEQLSSLGFEPETQLRRLSLLASLKPAVYINTKDSSLPITTCENADQVAIVAPYHIESMLLTYSRLQQLESKAPTTLVLAPTSTSLARKALSSIVKGRGWSLGEEVGFGWGIEDSNSWEVLRPLAALFDTEISTYWDLVTGEEASSEPPVLNKKGSNQDESIDALISAFLKTLNEDFSATVPTITKTVQKLGMRSADALEKNEKCWTCAVCNLPAQRNANEWINAITISSFTESNTVQQKGSSLASRLCYGCLLSIKGRKDQAVLSSLVDLNVKGSEPLDVRAVVQQYLL